MRTCRRFNFPPAFLISKYVSTRPSPPRFFQGKHLANFEWPNGLSPIENLSRHTLFPYFTAFRSEVSFNAAIHDALSTKGSKFGRRNSGRGLSLLTPYRRSCPQCVQDDLQRWGTSYWHRSHNVPGVLVCLKHQRFLGVSKIRTGGTRHCWDDRLPSDCAFTQLACGAPKSFDIAVARNSLLLLHTSRQDRPGVPTSWYKDQLAALGLIRDGSRVDPRKVEEWIDSIAKTPLKRYGLDVPSESRGWTRVLMVGTGDRAFSPLRHVIICTALQLADAGSKIDLQSRHGPHARARHSEDRKYAILLAALLSNYVKRRQVVTVRAALDEIGFRAVYYQFQSKYPLIAKALEELKRQNVAIADRLNDEVYAARFSAVVDKCRREGSCISVKDAVREAKLECAYSQDPSRRYPRLAKQIRRLKSSLTSVRPLGRHDEIYSGRLSRLITEYISDGVRVTVQQALEAAHCKSQYWRKPHLFPRVTRQICRLRRSSSTARPLPTTRSHKGREQ